MTRMRVLHRSSLLLGLVLALVAGTVTAQDGSAPTPRFQLRSLQNQVVPNASDSGRFAAVAQAQSRAIDSGGKRFALKGAAQCVAGQPTPGRVFANGFE